MSAIGDDPVWFITGCSTGFGRELAQLIINRGGRVVVTARDPDTLSDLAAVSPDRVLPLRLDVTKPEEIITAVREAEGKFGAIDVLVNNAGYGYLTALEEAEENEYRALFETNIFGPIAMARAVVPGMRVRGRGHIVNISSIVGFRGAPSAAFYSSTKFALEGFSESLSLELKPLGIRVTIVEPGSFRTDFAGRSMRSARNPIADYAETVGARIEHLKQSNGKQAGDPRRAAAAIFDIVSSDEPPLRLLLGADALEAARIKVAALKDEFDRWEAVTLSANFT